MVKAIQIFKSHPRGLGTLFMTEYWERFSYYGMRALLVLFLVETIDKGGFGFSASVATAIYGWYTALVYATAIPGGWLADKYLGLKRSVMFGGILISIGHFCLALGSPVIFYLGLAFIVTGTGCLKPNVSALVGSLYEKGDHRRDAGFSIFYMGINLGGLVAPLICGWLGQKMNWHYGFGAAGIGMVLGVIQYKLGMKSLANEDVKPLSSIIFPVAVMSAAILGISFFVLYAASLQRSTVGNLVSLGLFIGTLAWFGINVKKSTKEERGGLWAIVILFVFSALFWGAFEQAGSSLNLFAERFTDNSLLGWSFPSSWFQSVNSIFIITLAPVFAWLWIKLGDKEPSSPIKFAFGLLLVGLGFAIMAMAAQASHGEFKVSPMWLVVCYLFHTMGELCLSPVGLSTVTKLAPHRMVGSMMGIWFLSLSLGNKLGGTVAGYFETFPLPKLFGAVFATTAASAFVLFMLSPAIKKLMGKVN